MWGAPPKKDQTWDVCANQYHYWGKYVGGLSLWCLEFTDEDRNHPCTKKYCRISSLHLKLLPAESDNYPSGPGLTTLTGSSFQDLQYESVPDLPRDAKHSPWDLSLAQNELQPLFIGFLLWNKSNHSIFSFVKCEPICQLRSSADILLQVPSPNGLKHVAPEERVVSVVRPTEPQRCLPETCLFWRNL